MAFEECLYSIDNRFVRSNCGSVQQIRNKRAFLPHPREFVQFFGLNGHSIVYNFVCVRLLWCLFLRKLEAGEATLHFANLPTPSEILTTGIYYSIYHLQMYNVALMI